MGFDFMGGMSNSNPTIGDLGGSSSSSSSTGNFGNMGDISIGSDKKNWKDYIVIGIAIIGLIIVLKGR